MKSKQADLKQLGDDASINALSLIARRAGPG